MSKSSRILWILLVVVLLLVVLVFVQRSRYPDGTLLNQQRSYYAERVNQDLGEKIAALEPGVTTTAQVVEAMGEPSDRVEEDGLELWVYTTRVVKVTERRLLGLIPTGDATDGVESQMPVAVRDGFVVHTYLNPSPDPAVKQAVESMWDAYTTSR